MKTSTPKAWIVIVQFGMSDGDGSTFQGYISVFSDQNNAIEAVRKYEHLPEGGKIGNVSPISDTTFNAP